MYICKKGVANESLLLYVKGLVSTSIELSTQYYVRRISIFKVINGRSNYILISRAERERTSRQSSILGNLPRSPSLQLFEIFIEEDFCKKNV